MRTSLQRLTNNQDSLQADLEKKNAVLRRIGHSINQDMTAFTPPASAARPIGLEHNNGLGSQPPQTLSSDQNTKHGNAHTSGGNHQQSDANGNGVGNGKAHRKKKRSDRGEKADGDAGKRPHKYAAQSVHA